MIPAKFRLPLRSIPDFFTKSVQVRSNSFQVFCMKNSLGRVRLGVVVPKHIFPLATSRNHMKRVIKSQALLTTGVVKNTAGMDIVFRVKHGIRTLSHQEFISEIESALHLAHSKI